ncbi:hypothetical protein V498_03573 [Pseudogymnoascus sp. VKM F-4517 (FW-2822)]|nr:hypothetical protein V498_03573 [Pseudogymnoascus sp. VKM F-4517 (FW-2822)]
MQITKIITTVVATACVSSAFPSAHQEEEQKHPKGGDKTSLDGNMQCEGGKLYCCDSSAGFLDLLSLDCLLMNALGASCDNTQICCTQNGDGSEQTCQSQNGLINIS